jgi:hypothetical protein
MVETNIRVVLPGEALSLSTRRLKVTGALGDPEGLQQVCGRLSGRLKCACVPARNQQPEILVLAPDLIAPVTIEFEDWTADVEDTGLVRRLEFSSASDRFLLAGLLQRAILRRIQELGRWWRFNSYRMWYETEPFATSGDIAAFRRYVVSTVILEGVGIGIAVDVGTAFFTTRTVADYFAGGEGSEGQKRFERLSQRQRGQKGTLLYDRGKSKHVAYFDQFCPGVTCASTGTIRVKGNNYSSLYEYICQTHPSARVAPDEPVARVSFQGIDRPQPVPARRLRLRVMNDTLPAALADVDKLGPGERKAFTQSFWNMLGGQPFGPDGPRVADNFWRPPQERVILLPPPGLNFGKARRIEPPIDRSPAAYRVWFKDRMKNLFNGGVFFTPPTVERQLYFIAPRTTCGEAVRTFGRDLCDLITNWTGIPILAVEVTPYQTLEEGISLVQRQANSGVVVFVFEGDDPASYFEIEYGLKTWRVKRVTTGTLVRYFEGLKSLRDRAGQIQEASRQKKPFRDWQSFVRVCALDVIQKLGCLPWRVEPVSDFEAELSIDVGEDRRHYALSLIVNRPTDKQPDLLVSTLAGWKADVKHEAINPEVLREEAVRLFEPLSGGEPLSSLVVFRDGGECGQEPAALDDLVATLKQKRILAADAETVVVSVHKRSLKNIRLWHVNRDGSVANVLEGIAVRLDECSAVLCSTGAASLHKVTAEPVLLVARNGGGRIDRVAMHFFNSAQFNYSSPAVAQRLSIGLERTDEELKARAAQEIRGLR